MIKKYPRSYYENRDYFFLRASKENHISFFPKKNYEKICPPSKTIPKNLITDYLKPLIAIISMK
tara:strand:- start:318 stop:509 length:192 start_codon:yes stop_codon:yes gene_type:complete